MDWSLIISIVVVVLIVLQIGALIGLIVVSVRIVKNLIAKFQSQAARLSEHATRIRTVGVRAFGANRDRIEETVGEVRELVEGVRAKSHSAPLTGVPITFGNVRQALAFVGTARALHRRFITRAGVGKSSRNATLPPGPKQNSFGNPLLRAALNAGLLPPIVTRLGGAMTVLRFALGLRKAWQARIANAR